MGISMSKMLLSVGAGGAASLLIYALWRNDREPEEKPEILGLRNCGNSCFLNATLQALASCQYIQEWLQRKDHDCNYHYATPIQLLESYKDVNYPLMAAMLRGILIMNREIEGDDYTNACRVPGDVLAGLRFHGHKIGVQQEQDAYEVFLLIVGALNSEVELSIRRNQTGSMSVLTDGRILSEPPLPWSESEEIIPPVDIGAEGGEWALIDYDGSYRINDRIYSKRLIEFDYRMDYKSYPNMPMRLLIVTQMQCIACLTKSKIRIEACDALTLNMPPYDPSVGLTLHEMLLTYMKPTLVHKVDCETCTKNHLGGLAFLPGHKKVQSTYSKYNFIGKLPNTLCIHIPRCTWGPYGMMKRTDFVAFPERINLGMLKRFYDGKPKLIDFNAYRVFKQAADHECSLRRFKNSEYSLVAVISHVGSYGHSGHFVTFRKMPLKENSTLAMWYYVSDDAVHPVPVTYVLGTRAYMLFYERSQMI